MAIRRFQKSGKVLTTETGQKSGASLQEGWQGGLGAGRGEHPTTCRGGRRGAGLEVGSTGWKTKKGLRQGQRSDLEEAKVQRDHEDVVAPPATWLLLQLQPKVVPLAVTDSHLVQEEVGGTARAPGHRQGQHPPMQLWDRGTDLG